MSYLYISAAHKSSGKTTLTIGICAALAARGRKVQPFKKGPDYIDPLWLSAASGRGCVNLDFYTQERSEIMEEFGRGMGGADIGIIEGNKGLYDGLDLEGSNSNAALATMLDAPVVLVIDARGMTRGVAPLLIGYQGFDRNVRIAGVILNRVNGSRHESKLRQVVEHYTDLSVVGAVANDQELEIEERHLGLMPSNELSEAQTKIGLIAERISRQIDLHRIETIATSSPRPITTGEASERLAGERVRIGYARDRAFGFYYLGDLHSLERQGAELLPIDTLRDTELPPVDGLFLGGGFPETAMDELEANQSMRSSIREFVEGGGAVYAECGGLMYLSRSITWNGRSAKMVGAIPGDVVMREKPQGRGYVRLKETGNSPWPAGLPVGGEIPAHEFHYSALENLDPGLTYAYEVVRGSGIDGKRDGVVYKNMLASYTHLRDVAAHRWTTRFLAHVRRVKGNA